MAKEFSWVITEHIADLNEKSAAGWVKQLNIVRWGDNEPTYDIRSWHYPDDSETPDKMGKGTTLSKQELEKLKQVI